MINVELIKSHLSPSALYAGPRRQISTSCFTKVIEISLATKTSKSAPTSYIRILYYEGVQSTSYVLLWNTNYRQHSVSHNVVVLIAMIFPYLG